MSASGRPMFPAASAWTPAWRRRWATSAVVFVLPFVPVIAIQRVPDPDSARNPRSISDRIGTRASRAAARSEEHTSEHQSRGHLVCSLLLEKKNQTRNPSQHLY